MNRKIGVALSYVLMLFEVLSTLLLTPLIIRTLGDSEYGVYKLSASLVAYLLLLDLGIGNAVTRFVAKYHVSDNKLMCREFLGITTVFYAGVALICMLCGGVLILLFPTIFAKGLSADEVVLGQKLLLLTAINAAVTLGVSGFKNTIIAYERFDISRGISIVSIIVRVVLTVLALKLGFGSLGIVIITLAITIITSAYFVWFVIRKLHLSPIIKRGNFDLIKEVVSYSIFILIQMVATQVNACLDSVLLGMLVSSSSAIIAVYSVGQQITQYFQSIGSSVTGVLMPGVVKMVEHGADSDSICKEMIRIGRLIFMVLGIIWSVFLVYGKQFITLWVGESKLEAYWIALIFMSIYVFILTEAIGTQILWAKNEHKEQSIIKLSVVLLNIILTVILIKWNPLLGATIGTAISLLFGDIGAMNIVFVKKLKIKLSTYYSGIFRGIVPALLGTTIIGYLFSLIRLSGWIGFIVNVATMCVSYLLLMIFIGLSKYEKQLALGIIHSVLEKANVKKKL